MQKDYIGWLKLHRKLFNNPIITKDSDYLAVWIYLLVNAFYEESEFPCWFDKKKIYLKPGQLITGRKEIASFLRVTESKTQRILKCYEVEHQIEQQTTNASRLITIINWEEYQDIEQQIEQPMNNQRTTNEQPMNTIKELKNIRSKEVKKRDNIYAQKFQKFWDLYDKKIDKTKCETKFKKLTEKEIELIFEKLPDYVKSTPEIKFRKNPLTWLNGKCWNDEIIKKSDNREFEGKNYGESW